MKSRSPYGRRALVIAPHPDDEIIGAAALIHSFRRRGGRVIVVVVSDGAASHPASPSWPRERLVRTRKRETRRALRRLDVTAAEILFLDLPDSTLADHRADIRRGMRRVTAWHRPELIVGPALSDDHPDHRAVAHALAGIQVGVRHLAYHVWPPRSTPPPNGITAVMRGGHAAKRSLVRMHRTQTGAIRDDPQGFAIAPHELAAFAHPLEHFVEVSR